MAPGHGCHRCTNMSAKAGSKARRLQRSAPAALNFDGAALGGAVGQHGLLDLHRPHQPAEEARRDARVQLGTPAAVRESAPKPGRHLSEPCLSYMQIVSLFVAEHVVVTLASERRTLGKPAITASRCSSGVRPWPQTQAFRAALPPHDMIVAVQASGWTLYRHSGLARRAASSAGTVDPASRQVHLHKS